MESSYIETTALRKIMAMKRKYRFVSGGTGAGKTSTIMQILLDLVASKKGIRIDVVAETIPALRDGAWEDTNRIIRAQKLTEYVKVIMNPEMQVVFNNGSSIHFLAFDKASKAHGGRRYCLFINEANHVPWPIVDQLIVRTEGPIYADWNPSAQFWAYDEIIYNPAFAGQWDFVTLTYKDNEGLPESYVEQIESRKGNIKWWQVYGEGKLGTQEGRVFTDWQVIAGVPFEATLIRRGLDFGFTNDPTAIVALYEYNGGYILDEECYQPGLLNPAIADYLSLLSKPKTLIVADSSEPKSIVEIRTEGKDVPLNVLGAQKWSGSKRDGVNFLQGLRISLTARSTHLRKEVEQYFWLEDRISGKTTNNLPDGDDHAIDSALYAFNPLIVSNTRNAKSAKPQREWSYAQAFGGSR